MGLDPRTIQRWREQQGGEDRRDGPLTPPPHALTEAERETLLNTLNRPEYRDLSPKQVIPLLADKGEYQASESTAYRALRKGAAEELEHRESARPATARKRPAELIPHAPNQV